MKKILIFDTTLRDGEQSPGCSMSVKEKIELALQLERLKVDILEAGFASSSEGDFNSVKEISKVIKNCAVTSLSRAAKQDIDLTYESVKEAASPLIHIFLATSPVHLKYKLKMTEEQVLESVKTHVGYAKKLVSEVQFSAEDASRTPIEFLIKVYNEAVKAGATAINIADTVGYSTPQEMAEIVKSLKNNVKGIEKVRLAVHCHNDLGMAVSNTLACIKEGVTQADCTLMGIGERAGNASLEEIVMALKTRADYYNAYTDVATKQIYHSVKMLSAAIGRQIPENKAVVGANAFAHEAGIHQHGVLAEKSTYEIMSPADIGIPENKIVLGKHSGKHAFAEHLSDMGYQLSPDEILSAFEKFKQIADRKKYVSRKDLEALISHKQKEIKRDDFILKSYEIMSVKDRFARCFISLIKDGAVFEKSSEGDGPLDAAFKTINALTGKEINLTDFSVSSVTEGEDALGEAMVKICFGGAAYTGRGVSTDIIEASLLAYINGINKITNYE